MAHACPYCRVGIPDGASHCPHCAAPQPVAASPAPDWVQWVDPAEGAFAVQLPRNWVAQGGTLRDPATGLPTSRFEARGDPEGRTRVLIGGQAWSFQDASAAGMMGGLMGMFGGGEALPWCPAPAFAERWLLPRLKPARPDLQLLQAEPRPEAEATAREKLAADAAARGLGAYGVECSVAELLVGYREQGVALRERARVQTSRFLGGSMAWMTGLMPPTLWFGEIVWAYRAPEADFSAYEASLRHIAESCQKNPAWEAAQLHADNARALATQQQNQWRQQQISRTLSETSDIVAGSYWSRQQIQQQHAAGRQAKGSAGGDWGQAWSNAMLGWEDRVDAAGNRYSIEAGHERVWRDNQGNTIIGNALTNPDPTWTELKKPGT